MWHKAVYFTFLLLIGSFQLNAFTNDDFLTTKNPFAQDVEFLEVDDAFKFNFEQKGNTLKLSWQIADNYYLYADNFKYAAENAVIEGFDKPDATQIEDEFLVLPMCISLKQILKLNWLTSNQMRNLR